MGKVNATGFAGVVNARASSTRGVMPVGTTPVTTAIVHEVRGDGTQAAVTNASDLRNPLKAGSAAFSGPGGATMHILDVREATRVFFQGRVFMTPAAQFTAKPRYRVFAMQFEGLGDPLARLEDVNLANAVPGTLYRLDAAGMADAGAMEIDVPTSANIDAAGIGSVAMAHANGYAFTPWAPDDAAGLDVRGLQLLACIPDVAFTVSATDAAAFRYQLLAHALN